MSAAEVEVVETPEAEVVEPGEPQTGDELETEEPVEPGPPVEAEEPEAQRELSEKELEAIGKKLDGESTRHANRVSEILGEEAQALTPCPLCPDNMAGFIFADHLPDELRAAVVAFLTGTTDAAFVDDPDAEMCDRCNGMGEALTHSRVESQRTIVCKKCGGNGWTSPAQRSEWDSMVGSQRAAAEIQAQTQQPVTTTDGIADFDEWSRPRGAEFYGKNPRYMTAEEQARDWPGVKAAA